MAPEGGHAAHAQGSADVDYLIRARQSRRRAAADRDDESVSLCCSKMIRYFHASRLQSTQRLHSHSLGSHGEADAPWCRASRPGSRRNIAELMGPDPRSSFPPPERSLPLNRSSSPLKSHRSSNKSWEDPAPLPESGGSRQLDGEGPGGNVQMGSFGRRGLTAMSFERPGSGGGMSSGDVSLTLPDLPFGLVDAEDRDVLSSLPRGSFRAPRDERVHELKTPTPQGTPLATPTGSAISASMLLLASPKSANTITPVRSNEPAGWGHILEAYNNTLAPPPRQCNLGEFEDHLVQPIAPPRTPHGPHASCRRLSQELVVRAPRRPSLVADLHGHAAPRRASISDSHTPPRTARRASVTESLATPPRTGRRGSVVSSRRQSMEAETVLSVPRRLSIDDGVIMVPPRRGSSRRGSVVSRFSHTTSDRESSRTTARGSPLPHSPPQTMTLSSRIISENGEGAFSKGLVSIKADFGFEKNTCRGFENSVEFLDSGGGQGVSPHKELYTVDGENGIGSHSPVKSSGALDLVGNLVGILPFMGNEPAPPQHSRERVVSHRTSVLAETRPLLPANVPLGSPGSGRADFGSASHLW